METKIITKDSLIADIVNDYPETTEVLMEFGLSCIGCPMSTAESLEQGALVHGLDPEKVLERVKKRIEQEKEATK